MCLSFNLSLSGIMLHFLSFLLLLLLVFNQAIEGSLGFTVTADRIPVVCSSPLLVTPICLFLPCFSTHAIAWVRMHCKAV